MHDAAPQSTAKREHIRAQLEVGALRICKCIHDYKAGSRENVGRDAARVSIKGRIGRNDCAGLRTGVCSVENLVSSQCSVRSTPIGVAIHQRFTYSNADVIKSCRTDSPHCLGCEFVMANVSADRAINRPKQQLVDHRRRRRSP
jgi:hypothetical protein